MKTRSVRNKTTDILDYIQEHNLDIFVLSETWFSNKDPDLRVIRDEILRHLVTDWSTTQNPVVAVVALVYFIRIQSKQQL